MKKLANNVVEAEQTKNDTYIIGDPNKT